MADWLYPLSSKSEYHFLLDDELTADTGPSSFEQMIRQGARDDEWGAHRNWRRARPGDRVWPYYGTADGDLGVVGLATIRSIDAPEASGAAANVHLRWGRGTTKKLIITPFPAIEVRRYVPRPIGALWEVPPALASRLERHSSKPPTRPLPPPNPEPTDYANGAETTIAYTPPASVTVNRRHDALLRPMKARLETGGWASIEFDVGPGHVDLAMERRGKIVLIEAKTVKTSTREPVRAAFAQLSEYAWRYETTHPGSGRRVVRWALFEQQPREDEIRFLEDHRILVTWTDRPRRRFFHGPATARQAPARGL